MGLTRSHLAVLFIAMIPSLASAQAALELKGVVPGSALDDVERMFPGITVASYCSLGKEGKQLCMYIPPGSYSSSRRIANLDTLAGQPVEYWSINVIDGRVTRISVTLNNQAFQQIFQAIREKYGTESKLTNSTTQNRAGAAFDQIEATWTKDGRILTVKKRSGKIDQMDVTLTSTEELERAAEGMKEQAKKSAKDL
jgi:hypothetical protein